LSIGAHGALATFSARGSIVLSTSNSKIDQRQRATVDEEDPALFAAIQRY
jgi:hypothetical protein